MTAENRMSEAGQPGNYIIQNSLNPASDQQADWNPAVPESLAPAEALAQPVIPVPSRKSSIFKQIVSLVCLCFLAFASYFGVSHFLVQSVKVVGVSMVPTLHDSDNYLLNRWIYYTRSPKRSEIVVLRDPSDNGFSVKRVIATAGDSIFFKDGHVYINGQEVVETYLRPGTITVTGEAYRDKMIVCGAGQFFVLGDNRMNSVDSRVYGPVPRRNILGMIVP